MDSKVRDRLAAISALVHSRAKEAETDGPSTSPSNSRRQKDRLRVALADYYTSLEELNHVFQDINSTSALTYFDSDDAGLIRQAASSLSDARRAIRRLANREWLRKRPSNS